MTGVNPHDDHRDAPDGLTWLRAEEAAARTGDDPAAQAIRATDHLTNPDGSLREGVSPSDYWRAMEATRRARSGHTEAQHLRHLVLDLGLDGDAVRHRLRQLGAWPW